MSVKLILIRHGESESNVTRTSSGQSKCNLTEKGLDQAKRVGEYLKDHAIDFFYVSPLPRTRQTFDAILAHHPDVPVEFEPRIMEIHFGDLEGTPWGYKRKLANEKGVDFLEFKPNNGESIVDLQKRVLEFIGELAEKHTGKTVALVTHGGVMMSIYLKLLNYTQADIENIHSPNTGVTILNFTKDNITEELFNYRGHLNP